MAEDTDTGLIREIDEELRQDQLTQLWKQYGMYIIGGAAMIVASVSGYKGWESYDLSQRETLGTRYLAANSIALEGDLAGALAQFAAIARDGTAGYKSLSQFRSAGLLAQNGDFGAAALSYSALASDPVTPDSYRELATLLAALNQISASEDPGPVAGSLMDISQGASVWRYAAQEISAMAYIGAGDVDKANEVLSRLISDQSTPQGIRTRAEELLAVVTGS